MLTVWGRTTSSNVQKVMWAAAEIGVPVTRHDLGGPYGGLDTPEFRARNPHGLVPVVEFDDGVTMWESNAVVRRLALAEPARRLWPAEGQANADADMWAEWARLNSERAILQLFGAVVRVRPAERDFKVIEAAGRACHLALAAAEAQLGHHAFLAGPDLTIADIAFAPLLYRYYTMEIERPSLPAVEAYYARVEARPAYAEHCVHDYSFMRPK